MAAHRVPRPTVRDAWLRPILAERLGADELADLDAAAHGSYWESAVNRSLIGDEELLGLVAERLGVRRATRLAVSSQAREKVPEELARRYRILPLTVTDRTLEVATANPYDLDCERAVAFATGRCVRMSLASPSRIAERIEEVYRPQDTVSRLLERVATGHELEAVPEAPEGDTTTLDASAIDQPVVKLVDHIIGEGIAARASDIHIEPEEGGAVVRYRVDGVLRESMTLPRAVATPLVSRMKIMAALDIADRLRPQSGRARVAFAGRELDLRVSTLPVAHGEKVVIRILDAQTTVQSLDTLGFTAEAAARVGRLLAARDGLILVTGPTGSGKTTTLYGILRNLLARGVNIVTVEDPVEYRIPGIVQVQVNEKAGLTFATALRSILRQDPDIVLIGEIRDRETAAIAMQAALTGHLVFATLHTIDACTAVTRLADLGVERDKIAAALRGIVAQRLVRRLCPACGGNGTVVRGNALRPCGDCAGTAYVGRLALAEVVVSGRDLERAIAEGATAEALTTISRRDGAQPLWDAGVSQMQAGATTLEEVLRVVAAPAVTAPATCEYDSPPSAQAGTNASSADRIAMTEIRVGVVDVLVLRPGGDGWDVLVLQRAADTRCPGSWEIVHGSIERQERPEEAALREVQEETGLTAERLYNVTVNPFYLHSTGVLQLAVVFAAIVAADSVVTPCAEHAAHEWLSAPAARDRFTWPRSRDALDIVTRLLAGGDAGSAEDVMRVR